MALWTSFLNLFKWDTNNSEDLDSNFDVDKALNDNWTKIDNGIKKVSDEKVDKVTGKGLSTNDYTTAEKNKLAGLSNYNDTAVKNDISTNKNNISKNTTDITTLKGNITTINNKLDNIASTRGHIYTIRRKISNNTSAAWERLDDAVGLIANATKNGGTVQNDFDNLSPWKDIISFNLDLETGKKKAYYGDADFAFDGSNGDVYTHIPTFWIKIWQENDYWYISIADYNKADYKEIKEFDIARYLTGIGTDGKLHSYSGLAGADFKSIKQYRTLVQGLGSNYCLLDWRYFAIQCLYLVEYASFNSQSTLGNGCSAMRHNNGDVALLAESNTNRIIVNTSAGNSFVVGQQVRIGSYDSASSVIKTITAINSYTEGETNAKEIVFDGDPIASITLTTTIWTCVQSAGQCDSLGMKSGCLINDNKHNVIYRGIEGIHSNIFMFVDGINIKDCQAYICYDPAQYVSDKFEAPYEKLGYVNSKKEGWTKDLGFDINHPLIQLPTEIGANSSTGTTDYYWCSATGNRVARVGGISSNGTNVGLWYWTLSNASSYAGWGCGARVLKYQ